MSSKNTGNWISADQEQAKKAREDLQLWPLDEHNAVLLNEVHPQNYPDPTPHDVYDLVAIGAGAGGLVSSKQAARRGAKSAMISEHLAGGDCLNVGCVPSKALLRCMKSIKEVKRASQFGLKLQGDAQVDFPFIMSRLRRLRAKIAPADGHEGTTGTGAHVFQGRGRFTGPDTVEVNGKVLKFKKAVIATGGRPTVPPVPGLREAPFCTNENLFNLEELPPRMIVIGAGVIALEMAQTFAAFGSHVTVLKRSKLLKAQDVEAGEIIQSVMERDGVTFLGGVTKEVTTLRQPGEDGNSLPLVKVTVTKTDGTETDLECECLLVATGRAPNVQDLGLEHAGVESDDKSGILMDDLGRSISNPNVYCVGDCAAGVPRLTHMSGEMAKVVVENSLFGGDWKMSSLVVPAVMYTEPELASVGISGEAAAKAAGVDVDVYRTTLEHNDRAILEEENEGLVKIVCKKDTDEILGATIVAPRAGEMINEVSLAMKYKVGLRGIGRNIHAYPTTGEAVMGCGLQFINARWKRM